MDFIERAQLNKEHLSAAQLRYWEFLSNHLDWIVNYNISILSLKMQVNPTIITRLCQKLGFSGYSDFRLECTKYCSNIQVELKNSHHKNGVELIVDHIQELIGRIGKTIDEQVLVELVKDIRKTKKVIAIGSYRSSFAANMLRYGLIALSKSIQVVTETTIGYESEIIGDESDLIILFTVGGKSAYTQKLIESVLNRRIRLALISSSEHYKEDPRISYYLKLPSANSQSSKLFLNDTTIQMAFVDMILNYYVNVKEDNE